MKNVKILVSMLLMLLFLMQGSSQSALEVIKKADDKLKVPAVTPK